MTQRDSSPYTESSIIAAVLGDLRDLGRWLESSTVIRAYRRFSASLTNAADNSTLARLLSTLGAWLHASYCYRWLTAEPDPDVIVIDLRETYTVGPFIALLNHVQTRLERSWRTSNVARTSAEMISTVRDTPIRTASILTVIAVLTNTLVVTLNGSLTTMGLFTRGGLLSLALVGTRITTPWNQLTQARTVQLLAAALEPPELPDEEKR